MMRNQSLLSLLLFSLLNDRSVEAFRRHPSFLDDHDQSDDIDIDIDIGKSHMDTATQETLRRKLFVDEIDQQRRRISSNPSLPQPADHLVTDLPYLPKDSFPTKHYAGHIPASHNDDKKLFYWLFEPDLSDSNTQGNEGEIPLLIWLNGGPGCSSMDGLFIENGPFRLERTEDPDRKSNFAKGVDDGWTIQINPYSWHKAPAYVLYIDQPVGTGLSFTKSKRYCKNDKEVNIDFHLFLENFIIMYQDLFLKEEQHVGDNNDGKLLVREMKRPLYFAGESHAGHYIPSMMSYILSRNDDVVSPPRVNMNLRGCAIGNGWVDPYYQYAAADLAYSIGMIDSAQKQALDQKEHICQANLQNGNLKSGICFDLLDDIISDSDGRIGKAKLSIYDNREWEENGKSRSFPPGHQDVESYLGGWRAAVTGMSVNYKEVLKALHAEESINANQRFKECTDPPYMALANQDGLGVTKEVINILEHQTKPRMLFFNGMNDMICNHIGNEKLLDNLDWKYKKEWILARRFSWDYNSAFITDKTTQGPAGYIKEYNNLAFLKIASSGHMVPMDLPDTALEMMRKLMYHQSFGTNNQSLESKIPNQDCISCPKCSVAAGSESNNNDDGDTVEEANESRVLLTTQFVSGGWCGAIIGAALMVVLNVWRSRRTQGQVEFVSASQNDDIGYSDDPEVEMVTSPLKEARRGEFI